MSTPELDPEHIRDVLPPWCQSAEEGTHAAHRDHIVVSTRVRLARNLAEHHFKRQLSLVDQTHLVRSLADCCHRDLNGFRPFLMRELDEQSNWLLAERRCISQDICTSQSPAGVLVSDDETRMIMLNEEDHIRLQVLLPGLAIEQAHEHAVRLDRLLEHLGWAFDEQFGYLTSCPTNVGTGMRIGVMVHLPALVLSQHLERVLRGLSALHLAARGSYGEGSDSVGDYYQISNQRTLGISEKQLCRRIAKAVEAVCTAERLARETLVQHNRTRLEDHVYRSWACLLAARVLRHRECQRHLSAVRLGRALHLLDVPWAVLDMLALQTQSAHLRNRYGEPGLSNQRCRVLRADYVRDTLAPFANTDRN